ncbi:MAG: type II secretion system F family protein, partial [Acidobacteria bacterium]|nr:type II secretion system F family protein [Acidobacteriota bacterium]
MPVYLYRGRSRTGTEVRGQRQAASRQALANLLRKEQVRPVTIKEKGGRRFFSLGAGRVKSKELAVFTRQFSVMIDAGLSLVQCLESLEQQQENSAFQSVLQAVREDVENGTSLAAALEQHPRVFDPLYGSMVAAGEAGGILDTILRRLSTYIEKAVKLKRAVVSAMVYPAVVLAVAMAIVLLILWKVVPMFATLFTSLQA